MLLTCAILYDLIKEKVNISPFPEKHKDHPIEKILPLTGKNESDSTLYIAFSERDSPAWNVLTVCDEPQPGWYIASADPMEAFSILLQSVQEYQRWMEQCTYLAEVEHDTGAFLKYAAGFSDLTLSVFDRDYGIPYYSGTWQGEDVFKSGDMPVQEMEKLYQDDPDFDRTFQQRGLVPYAIEADNSHLYYQNMFQENFYLGRVLILVPEDADGEGMRQIFRQLCRLAEISYRYEFLHSGIRGSGKEAYELYRQFLTGSNCDQQKMEEALRARGWEADHEYQLLCLRSNGYFHSEQTIKYYAMHFEQLFPETVALQIESAMVCIHNLSRETDQNFHQKLVTFLRENLFTVGISNVCRNFYESSLYRQQAEDALVYGRKTDPSLWRYEFSDYVGEYCLSRCMDRYPARDLCPGNLRKILEYDALHPENELLETLRQYYICQFNAQHASEKLFIHRTTFFYRLRKMQGIAAFHPDDPKETRQFLLAFEALEREKLKDN